MASAPAFFQRAINQILQSIPGVICYLYDMLVIGTTHEEHLQRLEEVLKLLKSHGFRVKRNKCVFCQSSVEFLVISLQCWGIAWTTSKVAAILQAPELQNIQQLWLLLGWYTTTPCLSKTSLQCYICWTTYSCMMSSGSGPPRKPSS